jgi:hypothetical protein
MHPESSFSAKRFYPVFAGRSSLSLLAPLRISPLKSQLHRSAKLSLLGFITMVNKFIIVIALQSFKEHED